jgi:heme-degrading monooxygenase HmoA
MKAAFRNDVESAESARDATMGTFVAINSIHCRPDYCERFEALFRSRAHAIDRAPGFIRMMVLRPHGRPETPEGGEAASGPCGDCGSPYLVISEWESAECFQNWVGSPEFKEGHARGFEDIRLAKERGEESPMKSAFLTYEVVTR